MDFLWWRITDKNYSLQCKLLPIQGARYQYIVMINALQKSLTNNYVREMLSSIRPNTVFVTICSLMLVII
ncbi:hypothetical protein BH09BAC1_BH09BAC1_15510 [soil metagenome]